MVIGYVQVSACLASYLAIVCVQATHCNIMGFYCADVRIP